MSADDVDDVFFTDGVILQHVLPHQLDALFEAIHLLLVSEHAQDVVSCHDAQLGI